MVPLRQFSFFILLAAGAIVLPSLSILRSVPEAIYPQDSHQDVHPLVRDIRIISGQVVRDENAIIPSASPRIKNPLVGKVSGHQAKCLICHYADRSPRETHPGKFLQDHNPETFGCKLCHGGDDQSIEKTGAHTGEGEYPFLRGPLIETNCGKCHQEPAVPQAPYLSGGRFALNKYGCITCHALPIETPATRYAPNLDFAGTKLSREWLNQWLEKPTAYLPNSKMPKIEMTTQQRETIVEFLGTLRNDTPVLAFAGKGNIKAGERLFVDHQCLSCHTLHGGGTPNAPELERIGEKVSRSWLVNYLKSPRLLQPGSMMPDYGFNDQAALDLTEYLLSQSKRNRLGATMTTPRSSKESKTKGFSLFITKGCAQCHAIEKYRKGGIVEYLTGLDSDNVMDTIRDHGGIHSMTGTLDIPPSDLRMISIALSSLRRNQVYQQGRIKLEEGILGNVENFLKQFWQFPIPLQKSPPSFYNSTVSQLSPEACGTCHQQQWKDWQSTRHALAMGPGVLGQFSAYEPGFAEGCQQCHAPLSEQLERLASPSGEYVANNKFDSRLRGHGLVCASCHVREHQRFGPPFSNEAASASVFAEGHHGGAVASKAFEDSRFCSPCHQFEEEDFSLNGKLMENTYNEWLESPQARKGETCQRCHMPDRRHLWKGIHDPETVRKALRLSVELQSSQNGMVEAEIRLTNEGAAHHLPTYATPAIFVTTRLLDGTKMVIPGTEEVRAIQRRVSLDPDDTREIFDTRIPAGGVWSYRYRSHRSKSAKVLEVRIDVHPDHFYNGFFKKYQAANRQAQFMIRKAFRDTQKSPYHLLTKQFPI